MSSIAVHGGPTPHAVLRDVVDWGRVVVGTVARGVVATLLGLALWAAAPALIGWQPTTVMTGSMEPRLTPGDVVVSRPVASGEVRTGKILLAGDPDQPGHLRMHRYVEDGPGGTLVTKGDANPQQDSTPLERSAVHGVAFLRIPFVGAPVLWLRQGEWVRVVALALGLTALLALCTVDGSLRRLTAIDDDADDDGLDGGDTAHGSGDGPSDGTDTGREARDDAATRLPAATSTVVTRRSLRVHERRVQRLRRFGGAAAVLVIAGSVGVLVPAQAVAVPWSRTTVNPVSNFTAGTATGVPTLTCTAASSSTVTIAWTYTNPTVPNSFDLMNGTTQLATATTAGQRSLVYGGAGLLDLGTTYTLNLRTNLGNNWTATSTPTVKVQVVSVLGLASASCVP